MRSRKVVGDPGSAWADGDNCSRPGSIRVIRDHLTHPGMPREQITVPAALIGPDIVHLIHARGPRTHQRSPPLGGDWGGEVGVGVGELRDALLADFEDLGGFGCADEGGRQ